MLLLAAVPGFVLSLRGFRDPGTIDLEVSVLDLVAELLAAYGPAAIAVYLLWRDGRLRAAGFDRRPARSILGYGVLGWVCCFIGVITASIVVASIMVVAGGDPSEVGNDVDFDLTVGVALAGLAVALTAGVTEEIVFRGYAISRLEEAGHARAAVWLPWAVFTVLHLYQGPLSLVFVGIVGGVFTWLFRWQRSVWPVMVAHALYDITVLLFAALAA